MSQGVVNRGSLISVPLALRVFPRLGLEVPNICLSVTGDWPGSLDAQIAGDVKSNPLAISNRSN